MTGGAITNIPHFLKARSPEGLRRSMLKNNIKHGLIFDYYQINHVDGFWYAWFQLDAVDAMAEELKEIEQRGKGE